MKKILISSVAVFALAFAMTSHAATAEDMGSSTLRKGSSGMYVMALQKNLNACAAMSLATDGKFGKGTAAAAMSFQTSKGLVADGVVGSKTKAAIAAACAGSTPSTPSVPVVTSGAEGYLADISSDSTNRVSTVYESEMDKVVVGVRATARLADQTISRVTVKFHNTNSTASANLGKYISSVSLWNGSTKLATMAVADASRDNSDIYTFQFTGFNSVISKDQIGRLYVSVNANGSLDSTDTTNAKWWVSIPSDGIRSTSPNGVYATASMTAVQVGTDTTNAGGLSFGKFSANGVKAEVTLSSANPASAVVAVNNTIATNNVELLKFKIKATNSDLNLRKIPIQVTLTPVAASDDVVNVINTIKLLKDGSALDSADGSAGYQFTAGSESTSTSGTACSDGDNTANDLCTFYFSNLSGVKIASGTTAEFSVVADFKAQSNYSTGVAIAAALSGFDVLSSDDFSVQDTNGDQLTDASATVRVGSAIGNVQTLRVTGLQVTMGTGSISLNTRGGTTFANDVVRATFTVPLTLQAFGQTLYVGAGALYGADATGTTTSAKAVAFGFEKGSAPSTTVNSGALDTNVSAATTGPTFTCNAPVEGAYDAYRIDSGATVNCTLTVTLNNTGAGATTATESYRVQLNDVRFFTNNDLTTGAANQDLLPTYSYQTGFATGVSTSA